jgi:hypothetical protein
MVTVLKTVLAQANVGSNPTPSAIVFNPPSRIQAKSSVVH